MLGKKRRLFFTIIILSVVLTPQLLKGSSSRNNEHPITSNPEWKSMDRPQRVKVSQIPEGILAGMPTEVLIDEVLRYPLRIDFLVFNTYRAGFNRVLVDFNGLQELVEREDVGVKLLEKYREFELGHEETLIDLMLIELLLNQPEIRSNTDPAVLKEIEIEAQNMHERKKHFKDLYGTAITYFEIQRQMEEGLDN